MSNLNLDGIPQVGDFGTAYKPELFRLGVRLIAVGNSTYTGQLLTDPTKLIIFHSCRFIPQWMPGGVMSINQMADGFQDVPTAVLQPKVSANYMEAAEDVILKHWIRTNAVYTLLCGYKKVVTNPTTTPRQCRIFERTWAKHIFNSPKPHLFKKHLNYNGFLNLIERLFPVESTATT